MHAGNVGCGLVAAVLQYLAEATTLDQQAQVSRFVIAGQLVGGEQTFIQLLGLFQRADCSKIFRHQGNRAAFARHQLFSVLQLHHGGTEFALTHVTVGEKTMFGGGLSRLFLFLVRAAGKAEHCAE